MKPKGKRLYIAGPMSGKPSFGIPAFDVAARRLREEGHDVVSPAELDDKQFRALCLTCRTGGMEELHRRCKETGTPVETWGDLLARDLKLIANDGIEGIVVLPDWDKSRGATLETYVGRLCGLPILYYPDLAPVVQVELERVHGQATKPFGEPERFVTREGEIRRVDQKTVKVPDFETAVKGMEKAIPARAKAAAERLREVRVTSETGGVKGEKSATLGDFAPEALMKVAEVAGFGRIKYARLNYLKGYDWSLSYDALQRHLHAFWGKEDMDPESGLLHLSHAGWHVLCLLAFHLRKLGTDDRP